MSEKGKQTIRCDVCECRHHNDDDVCELKAIAVSSVPAKPNVRSADESMCASFECECGCRD